MEPESVDVCLITEGTYPYITGGVSSWAHELIKTQSHLSFHLVCILPQNAKPKIKYDLPENVKGITNIFLQELPGKNRRISQKKREKFFVDTELALLNLQHRPSLRDIETINHALQELSGKISEFFLLNSKESWNQVIRMYSATMGETSFLDFFWSWRGLISSFYSVIMADLPEAKVYHATCSGYAGLYLAKAYVETGKPCMVTEHGIYTNERMIQLIASDWLHELDHRSFNIKKKAYNRDLKDFWMDLFTGYSKLCYQVSSKILTLYEGNVSFQIADGADPKKIAIVPNGVDYDSYSSLEMDNDHPPTVALIGRVVPIKDIKTYIRAAEIVRRKVPNVIFWIMGPTDEDKMYYEECLDMVEKNDLQETVIFLGKTNIKEYLPKVDVNVLTSISEAQPLTILEAGAAGIPFVSTIVGCCAEFAHGRSDEQPNLGQAGFVCPLTNAQEIGEAITKLLTQKELRKRFGETLQKRINTYYRYDTFVDNYHKIYDEMVEESLQCQE